MSASEYVIRVDTQNLADRDVSGEGGDDEDHAQREGEIAVRDDGRVVGHPKLGECDEPRTETDAKAIPGESGEGRLEEYHCDELVALRPDSLERSEFLDVLEHECVEGLP